MLVAFSAYRESVGAPRGLWALCIRDARLFAVGTIRIAVQQGWMNSYTDGSFRPDNTVTLEEACAAVLKCWAMRPPT